MQAKINLRIEVGRQAIVEGKGIVADGAYFDGLRDRLTSAEELQEAIDSIETEPTYAAEDVHKWMKSWGTENELPSPRRVLKRNIFNNS